MSSEKTNQSWGGRFSEPVDAFVARFTASVEFDKRLYRHDIMGSIAHASMLAKVGVLTDAERDAIIDGLKQIKGEIEAGTFDWRVDLEDVHMNIEARLTDRIGITGKKLHTGRSRNDQVATDIRLYVRAAIDDARKSFVDVLLVDTAGRALLPPLLREVLSPSLAADVGPAVASIAMYLLMAGVLVFKPSGLFPARA